MQPPIPDEWRQAVCRILSSGSLGKEIIVTARASRDWQAMFPDAFNCDLFTALSSALKNPEIAGRQILTMEEPGTVYEFLFHREERQVYAKINLQPDGKIIIIYSAHRPLKGPSL